MLIPLFIYSRQHLLSWYIFYFSNYNIFPIIWKRVLEIPPCDVIEVKPLQLAPYVKKVKAQNTIYDSLEDTLMIFKHILLISAYYSFIRIFIIP